MKEREGKSLYHKFMVFAATGAYSGYSPVAPGTAGTLVTIPLVYLLSFFPSRTHLFAILILFFLGVLSSSFCVRAFKQKDPSRVVIDEVVGFLITMFLVPLTARTVLLGFFIFRLADIIKPFPARRSEKLPSGWGIMMDDVFAGIYGNIGLQILWHFWWN